jgi:cytochrome c oxidase subunit 4
MSSQPNTDISSKEYDPTTWVPEPDTHGTADIKKTFWILLFLTIVDVILYFLIPTEYVLGRAFAFVLLGIVKAIYIVGTFMHMKHEKLGLATMIIAPMFFIIFFLVWMMYEGNFWGTI